MSKRLRKPYLDPAATIVSVFGGREVVARVAGVSSHRVHAWMRPSSVGGTDGRIPTKHLLKLLKYAEENNLPLSARDFIGSEVA